jgi:hypothetical protein
MLNPLLIMLNLGHRATQLKQRSLCSYQLNFEDIRNWDSQWLVSPWLVSQGKKCDLSNPKLAIG